MKLFAYIFIIFYLVVSVAHAREENIFNISLSPDGSKIFVYRDSTIDILNSNTLQTITSIPIDTQKKVNAIWSPNSNYIAIAIEGGVIEIWDSNIGLLISTLLGHPQGSEISDMEWIDNTLYSMNLFGVLIIWDMVNYQTVQVLSVDGNDLALSPDGKTLAIATFLDIFLLNLDTMAITKFVEQTVQITSVVWSSNGQKIAGSFMDGTIHIWSLDDNINPEIIWDVNTPNETPWIADLLWNDGYLAVRQLYNDSVTILDDQTGEKLDNILVENGRFIWSGNTGYYATFQNEPIQLHQYCDAITQPENISNISQEIIAGNASAFGNTICLSPDATYTLTATLPSITGEITIIGNGAIINMTGGAQIFNVAETGALTLKAVTISGGNAEQGGAIYNVGDLNLENVTLENNSAVRGGAIYNMGNLTMNGGAIQNNSASEFGGGIYNVGEMSLDGVNITENNAPEGSGVYQGE